VPRSVKERRLQKSLLLGHLPEYRKDILEALASCGRMNVKDELLGGNQQKPKGKGSKFKGRR
jgi:hypothetical protein